MRGAESCCSWVPETEVAVCSCLCADVAPIVLRMWKGRKFTPGPYSMGHAQPWVNVGALIYILVSTVSLSQHAGLEALLSTRMPKRARHPSMGHVCGLQAVCGIHNMYAWVVGMPFSSTFR